MTPQDWLRTAPEGLARLVRNLTWHHRVRWDAPDYIEDQEFGEGGDGRKTTDDVDVVEAFSSARRPGPFDDPEAPPVHALLIDLDVPAWLVPSSTEGHGHLYVDLAVQEGDLWEFLDAAAMIGLVEEGYVSACKSRGMTSLRAPWVTKGQERPPGTTLEEAWVDTQHADVPTAEETM